NKNEYDIFSINADGSDLRQLTKNASRRNFDPVVSPDNRLIVFVSKRTGADRLWIMNRDGSEPRQLTPPSDDKQTGEVIPYFSPDGKWIYYTVFRNTSASIYKISIEGGEPVQVSPPGKERFTPVVSPDGNSFAFASHDPEAKRAWSIGVQSLADGKERFFDFPAFRQLARWMPDSQSLVTMEHNFHGANLWQTNLETGERRQITNFTAERLYRFDVSRDGRFFAVARGNGFYDAVLIER
ncbi:MAG TPA: DPP IV N-terminal domain-containing protein, partial [Pyrinomonadaceae bacterium]|nr:DPP IV N-terminal domain-containing protein [Pyrinomonadaceae bacterium]